jgi:hypothetical protein
MEGTADPSAPLEDDDFVEELEIQLVGYEGARKI